MPITFKSMQRRGAHFMSGIVLAVMALSLAVPVRAQQARPVTLRVTVDHATALALDAPAGAVLIADPEIADIVNERGHLLFVLGKKPGDTNLLVYDGAGKRLFEREVIVVPPDADAVTVTRETDQTDYTCAPRCAFRAHLAGGATPDSGAGAAAASAGPAMPPGLAAPPMAPLPMTGLTVKP